MGLNGIHRTPWDMWDYHMGLLRMHGTSTYDPKGLVGLPNGNMGTHVTPGDTWDYHMGLKSHGSPPGVPCVP